MDFKVFSNIYPNLGPDISLQVGVYVGGKVWISSFWPTGTPSYPKILAIVVSVPSKFTGHHDVPFPMNSLEIDLLGYRFTGESIPQGVV